jgi:hypothetical protein
MANWCSNYLTIEGPDYEKVRALFSRLLNKQKKLNLGVTYKYFNDDRYLFDIYIDQYISFETKWVAPIDTVMYIFNKYNIEGSLTYMEGGMGIYGKVVKYQNRILQVELTHDEVENMPYEQDEYEEDYHDELIEILLDKKIREIKKGLAV